MFRPKSLLTASILMGVAMSVQALTDPTKPSTFIGFTQERPLSQGLTLTMIVTTGNKRAAVINQSLLEVADTIDNAVIVEIESDSVVLKRGEKTIVLRLPLASVKKEIAHD